MSLDRRQFVQRLLMGAVALPFAAELDLERLLWVPKSMVTVPEMPCFDLNTLFEQVARERTLALDAEYMRRTRGGFYLPPDTERMTFKGQPLVWDFERLVGGGVRSGPLRFEYDPEDVW